MPAGYALPAETWRAFFSATLRHAHSTSVSRLPLSSSLELSLICALRISPRETLISWEPISRPLSCQ